jgi:cysteine desulfurase
MGEAMRLAAQEMSGESNKLKYLCDKLWNGIKNIPNIQLNGSPINRITNNLNISFPNIDGDVLIPALTDIAISKASTCLNKQPSYVLEALGLSRNLIANTIRISIGRFTTEEEINYTIMHINNILKQFN